MQTHMKVFSSSTTIGVADRFNQWADTMSMHVVATGIRHIPPYNNHPDCTVQMWVVYEVV